MEVTIACNLFPTEQLPLNIMLKGSIIHKVLGMPAGTQIPSNRAQWLMPNFQFMVKVAFG